MAQRETSSGIPTAEASSNPAFPVAKLISLQDGRPLDTGWGAAPLVADWDGDGLQDLLVGTERNRILFYRNTGTNSLPSLVNQGFVETDGKPLQLPTEPVPNASTEIFKLDYYPGRRHRHRRERKSCRVNQSGRRRIRTKCTHQVSSGPIWSSCRRCGLEPGR